MPDTKKTMANDLTVGSVPRQLIRFALPLVASGLLQIVYNMVDASVVGRVVGSDGLAGVTIGGDILNTTTFLAFGFASAGQVIISQFVGAGRMDKVRRTIGTLFTFLFLLAIVVTGGVLAFEDPILSALNTSVEAWDHAKDYLTTCILGMIFISGYNLVSAILRGMGDSRRPFIFIAIASTLNVVLDILFVAALRWGAMGAALATVASQGVSFLLAIVYLYRNREAFGFDFKPASFRICRDELVSIIKLGIPMVLQSAAISGSRLFVSAHINSYGYMATAVTGIGTKLDNTINIFNGSMNAAGGAMVGQCIGAEKYDRVPKIISSSFFVDLAVSGAAAIVLVLFPKLVFGLFTNEPETLEMCMAYIPVALLSFLASVVRSPFFSLISGSGNATLNLIVGLVDGVVARIGFSFLLGEAFGMGILGYWYGAALAGFMPFLIGGVYFLSGKWRTRKHVMKE